MKRIHRRIEIDADRAYLLECHCRINYACDSPWKREVPYEQYQAEWLGLTRQIDDFIGALAESMEDPRSLAEIIEQEDGERVAYLWAPFYADAESGFCFAQLQDIFVEEAFRGQGVASELMRYAEQKAVENGAKVIRSGTGCANQPSIGLHQRLGYGVYRYEFEKVLK